MESDFRPASVLLALRSPASVLLALRSPAAASFSMLDRLTVISAFSGYKRAAGGNQKKRGEQQ